MNVSLRNALLFTLAALGCIALRWLWSGHLAFLFLTWNLVLAWVPLLFVFDLNKNASSRPLPAWIKTGCWLAFFPNAPYLFTDLLHLHQRPGVPLWMDLILLLLAAWAGWQTGLLSWREVVHYWEKHLPKPVFSATMGAFPFVCAWGVYLGRFLRFNSWEILTQPMALLSGFASSLRQPGISVSMVGFTLAFGVMLHLLLFTQGTQPVLTVKKEMI